MGKINRKKGRDVIHVRIGLSSENNIRKKHFQNDSFSSDTIHQKNAITSQNKKTFHGQQDFIHPSFPVNLDQKYPSQRNRNINQRSMVTNKQDRSVLGLNNCILSSERSLLSIVKMKPKNNRVIPSLETSSVVEKEKDLVLINMKSEKKRRGKYCGLPLWLLLLLLYTLLAVLVIIAVVTIGILTTSKEQSSLTLISTVTTTSSTSVTSTTTSTTTTTTTTTFYTCSNYTVTANWDYSGNDVISNGPGTFANCCAWCLTLTFCAAFTFNPWNTCLIKNSTGSGGGPYSNSIGVAR